MDAERMRVLTADQGNTKIKFTLFDGGRRVASAAVRTDAPEEILPIVDSWHPDGGIFSSVGKFDIRFVETLRQLVDDRLLVLTPHTPLPVGVEYETPQTLGVDRLSTAVGAFALLGGRGGTIADCGSALTVDVLKPGGVFAGGRISPGVMMRMKSLHEFTARLPLVEPEGDTPVCGHSTSTAIRSGVVRGIAGELVTAAAAYAAMTGGARLLLTGGDAPLLEPFVRESVGSLGLAMDLLTVPDLLDRGLLEIYRFNLDK